MNRLEQNYFTLLNDIKHISNNRNPNSPVCLIAVSKTFPANDIRKLYTIGQTAFAENYAQEFSLKAEQLKDLQIEWHFIGRVQSNKTRLIAKYANWLHSLADARHAIRLNNHRLSAMPELNVLIEVNLSGDAARHGLITLKQINNLAAIINQQKNLRLRGFMGIASATTDKELLRQQFTALAQLFKQLKQAYGNQIDTLSMGMSGDYRSAIECGSTMLRIGSLIFGPRN